MMELNWLSLAECIRLIDCHNSAVTNFTLGYLDGGRSGASSLSLLTATTQEGHCERKVIYEVIGQQKAPDRMDWVLSIITSLTMTYFHTGCSTIIGAKSFHGPVRDGKGWYQLAIVIRHNL